MIAEHGTEMQSPRVQSGRPISMIRYPAGLGESGDRSAASHDPGCIPLVTDPGDDFSGPMAAVRRGGAGVGETLRRGHGDAVTCRS